MNYEEIKEELRAIVNLSARNFRAEQRKRVEEIATELGLALPERSRCNSCWIDLAVACASEIDRRNADANTEQGEQAEKHDEGRKYVLQDGTNLIFIYGGKKVRVNALTLTDELAAEIISHGFPKKYFAKCE